ncbi:hypothetical protein UFOVP346_46 [uncultured Caudovirales phage]|uniref:Uncharacterized protein n=1 Tax=uncultured Caudovirales phage TaxID=2100421 RepID=A0A6J5M6G6_9CAUD|nr:hypothetical protein UFOVP346_46 [uncultured Caudovirales phage]
MEKVEEQIGRTPEALKGSEFPELMENVWSVFLFLNATRGQGTNGVLPISYQEIKAWAELTQRELSPWEVDAITRLDRVYMRVINV